MPIVSILYLLFYLVDAAIVVLVLIGMWKVFVKAGQKGWKALIPVYNYVILFRIVEGKGIRCLLLLIPFYGIYVYVMLCLRWAKCFGKDTGFGVGLIFLSSVFTLILGFDSSKYLGPVEIEEQ